MIRSINPTSQQKQSFKKAGHHTHHEPVQTDVGLDGPAAHDVGREGLGEEAAEEEGRHEAQPAEAAAEAGQRVPHRRSHFLLRPED